MERIWKYISAVIGGIAASIGLHAQPQGWEWTGLARDAEYGSVSIELFGATQSISAVRCPISRSQVELVNTPGKNRRGSRTPSAFGKRFGARAVINGSYFNMKTMYPSTFIRDNRKDVGTTMTDEQFRIDGIFVIRGREAAAIRTADTLALRRAMEHGHEIMAAGPMLVADGAILGGWPTGEGFFDTRHPRSIVGTSADGYIYFIVIDGRHPGHAAGVTIPEAAEIARMFGLEDALNLDGGGSSALWVKGAGVISHPSDNKKYDNQGERKIPNALIFR